MIDYLIIGKNGQLASELNQILKSKKANFKSFSRNELDVSNHELVNRRIKSLKPKVIINTSAYHVLSDCEKYPLKAFEINSVAVGNLAKISKEIGARFVTLSTNYVFDGNIKSKYLEDDKVNPLQIYGLSKLAGEFDALSKYPERTYIIRTCGLYGNGKEGSLDKGGNFILKVINEARSTGFVKASKTETVNPTYAKDLAASILKLASLKAESGVYHLVNEGETNWYEFAKQILKHKKIDAKIVVLKSNIGLYQRPLNSMLKNTKAKKLGIVLPRINKSLEKYLESLG